MHIIAFNIRRPGLDTPFLSCERRMHPTMTADDFAAAARRSALGAMQSGPITLECIYRCEDGTARSLHASYP